MRANRIISRLLIVLAILSSLFIGYAAYKYITVKPPIAEIDKARESIARAKSAHAGTYASTRLHEAENLFDAAMAEWTLQNVRFFAFRDFAHVKDLATASLNISIDAQTEAGTEKDKYARQLELKIQQTTSQINLFENHYKNLPLGRANFDRYNKGKILYLEALHEYNNKNHQKALKLIDQAAAKLDQAEKATQSKLNSFYEDYPDWEKNIEQAFLLSKKQTIVLVNKMEATLAVLKGGKVSKVFDAEFGPNWMGDKIMKGDRATPQGIYKVTKKKKDSATKYHKALLLNYPNNEDIDRFDRLKKAGSISKSAHIGSLIEIHGHGGKGVHWTEGCVALTDKEMDMVYDMCPVGTLVFIVGSDKTLDEYLNAIK